MIIVQTKQVIIMTLFKHTKIEEAEDFAHGRLLNAFETSHKRHLVDSNDEDLVSADDGAGLSAVCHSARLCWARFLSRELACRFHYDVKTGAINGKVYFFTLVDVGCRRSVDEFEMDLKPIIRKLRSGIRDRSFIGVIEPGLYSHVSAADGMAPGECPALGDIAKAGETTGGGIERLGKVRAALAPARWCVSADRPRRRTL